ncbi:MAG: M23 family metallopeptidase [Frankiaceae bacterium]|nr:M23 family metallopeptidase [Frankiaceae bacterium]
MPLIAAGFLGFLTIGVFWLANPSDSPSTTNSADAAYQATGQHSASDNRVSRDKRDAIDTDTIAADTAAAAPDSPDSPDAGSAPLAGQGAGDQTLTDVPPAPGDPGAADAATLVDIPVGVPADAVPTGYATAEPPPQPVWVRPTDGGNMTSCFCWRSTVFGSGFHDGIDIDPPLGTPIYAVGDGTVVYAGPLSGYGVGIFIRHDNGDVSFYGHERTALVSTGDTVSAGDMIARVGNEGQSTGPHLHFGVYQGWVSIKAMGTAIDPVPWLAARGITIGPYDPNG